MMGEQAKIRGTISARERMSRCIAMLIDTEQDATTEATNITPAEQEQLDMFAELDRLAEMCGHPRDEDRLRDKLDMIAECRRVRAMDAGEYYEQ